MDNNYKIKRTDTSDKDFGKLIISLDKELGNNYSEAYDFYHQYNQVDDIKNVIVVYNNEDAVGCGAIKKYDENSMEVKRMFTVHESRGKGIASVVLNALEEWTKELQCNTCILETGTKQFAAIALYQKKGYEIIPNYGQYIGVPTSICFQKSLSI